MALTLAYRIFVTFVSWTVLQARPDRAKEIEILVLRHQLVVLQRRTPRPRLRWTDRAVIAVLARLLPPHRRLGLLVTPSTIIVTFECPRCSSNTVLQSDGADTLLVNTIGSYSGRQLIDAMDGSSTNTLTVKATGSWKITVASGLVSAKRGDTSVTGRGDDVVLLTASISKAAIINKGGSSNFVVRAYESSASFPNLAVNTIGGYSGTVPIHGPCVLAIMSTGSWSITGT